MTPGNPRVLAPRHLQIPPTQGVSRKRRPKTQKGRPLENEDLENKDPLENEDLENEDPLENKDLENEDPLENENLENKDP